MAEKVTKKPAAAAAKKQAAPERKRKAPAAAGKKQAPAAKKGKLWHREKQPNPLFVPRPKNFRIGGDIPHRRDLTRFVRWPWYIRLQRQKRVLFNRLKVPPPINQFSQVLNHASACHLFRILNKIRPEERAAKKRRRMELAKKIAAARHVHHEEAKARKAAKEAAAKDTKKEEGKEVAKEPAKKEKKPAKKDAVAKTEKPMTVKYGLNHVTRLVEKNKAQLVVIASDVDPIELVVWLPTLCRKKQVPYCIIKNKARLGRVVHKKTSAVLAITQVPKEDRPSFNKIIEACKTEFNNNEHIMKTWGGKQLGIKRRQQIARHHRLLRKENSRKAKGTK